MNLAFVLLTMFGTLAFVLIPAYIILEEPTLPPYIRNIPTKIKSWFKKKPKLYSASEIALMSKMGENNELNKLTEEFYLKFQEQYLKDAHDLIIIYSGSYENLQYYPLETSIYKLISKEEKNLQQFMDFFRKKGWFIRQDIQELSKKKGKYAMFQQEGLKFTISLSEFSEE